MSELNVNFLAPKQPISLNLQGSETPTTQKTPTIPVKSEENLDTFQKTGPIEEAPAAAEAPAAEEETVAVQEQAKEGTNKKERKGLNLRRLFTRTFWQDLGRKIEDALETAWKWFWGEPEKK